MMARAPGKLVLSGAYSVLEGAPALVAAVDRHAYADGARCAELLTEEVAEAVRRGLLSKAPWFDASELRMRTAGAQDATRKLGLGSSAAILVASLAVGRAAAVAAPQSLAEEVLGPALEVHRAAQGGGSGVDVAASCLGGVLRFVRREPPDLPLLTPIELPAGLVISPYLCPAPASTRLLLSAVTALRESKPAQYRALVAQAATEAERVAAAAAPADWLAAAARQGRSLRELGRAAGIAIVTPEMAELAALAEHAGGAFVPAGAGGGDVALYVGTVPETDAWQARAFELGLRALALRLGAPGLTLVRALPSERAPTRGALP